MGFEWADDVEHISFGLITFNGKKMSTRKGDVVLLKDVLNDAHDLALKQIQERTQPLKQGSSCRTSRCGCRLPRFDE